MNGEHGATAPVRRGRREAPLGPGIPAHRRAFAQALRDLRSECGAPPYRELSRLAHCAAGTLSEAAGGQQLPSWETTRAYVTGCLRHAGRADETGPVLRRWQERWERTRLAGDAPAPVVPLPRRHTFGRRRLVAAAAVLLVAPAGLHRSAAPDPPPMTGLYNIVLAAPSATDGELGLRLAAQLHRLLAAELDAWAAGTPAVQIRGVRLADGLSTRTAARVHGADIVLQPVLRHDDRRVTLSVGMLVTGRALGETPEFAGRHDLGTTEPIDVAERNPRVHERLAGSTLHYLEAMMAFVRGLGDYALGDFPAAERSLLAADRGFGEAGASGDRRAVVQLMLGNAVGAQDLSRAGEAAGYFRQALAADPAYPRTNLGLADALRVTVPCTPGAAGTDRLREAAVHYRRALQAPASVQVGRQALLSAKAQLGLGLVDQCLALIGATPRWCDADKHFTAALVLTGRVPPAPSSSSAPWSLSSAAPDAPGDAARQARWLAAEARAGLALNALAGEQHYVKAAARYEEALAVLGGIDVVRRPYLERRLALLRSLRVAYEKLGRPGDLAGTDLRIGDTGRQITALAAAPGR